MKLPEAREVSGGGSEVHVKELVPPRVSVLLVHT
jgi:hypothetical protein